jgi:hypothetical protein
MLVSGIGFVIASYAALPLGQAADAAFYSGSLLGILGLVDLILNWGKTIAETRKAAADTAKAAADTIKALAEAEDIRRRQTAASNQSVPSSLVPPEIVVLEARRFGLDPALGTHLIRCCPRLQMQADHIRVAFACGHVLRAGSQGRRANQRSRVAAAPQITPDKTPMYQRIEGMPSWSQILRASRLSISRVAVLEFWHRSPDSRRSCDGRLLWQECIHIAASEPAARAASP